MILPQSYLATLIVMIVAMFCLGSWASTFKMTRRWRFELYYFDFAFGVLLTTLLIAFTLGSMGFDGFSFTDDLMHGGKHQWLYGFAAGILFNLANMLLIAAVSVAGMAVSFPLALGCALVVASIFAVLSGSAANPMLLAAGGVMILLAIVADFIAYGGLVVQRHEELAKAGKAKSTRRPGTAKVLILCLVSGLLMSAAPPLVRLAMEGELGIGPYSTSFVFAIGLFFSAIVFNIFFVNLPVEGEPVEIGAYFNAPPKNHLLGLLGGALLSIGWTSVLVARTVPGEANLGPGMNAYLPEAMVVIAVLWGLLVWREFSRTELKLKLIATLMLVFYICGLALLSLAPMFAHKS